MHAAAACQPSPRWAAACSRLPRRSDSPRSGCDDSHAKQTSVGQNDVRSAIRRPTLRGSMAHSGRSDRKGTAGELLLDQPIGAARTPPGFEPLVTALGGGTLDFAAMLAIADIIP